MANPKPYRTQTELLQTFEKHQGFNHITTSDNAEDVLIVKMEEGNKISIFVDFFDALIEFDGDATSDSMLIRVNTGYFDEGIYITEKISVKNVLSGQNTRIRGILWGR